MYITPLRSRKTAVGFNNSEYPLPPLSVKPATVIPLGGPIVVPAKI